MAIFVLTTTTTTTRPITLPLAHARGVMMYFTLSYRASRIICVSGSVGIEELSGMEYGIITEGMVRSLFGVNIFVNVL